MEDLKEKYPNKFRITATLRGPVESTEEDVKLVLRCACRGLTIEKVERIED